MKKLREAVEKIRARLSTRAENITHHEQRLKHLRQSQEQRDAEIRAEIGKLKRLRADQASDRERLAKVRARIKELEERGVKIDLGYPNKVTGGKGPGERFQAAVLKAVELDTTKGHRYYSQPGGWDLGYVISGEPAGSGLRSDCSQFVLGVIKACGLPDPGNTDFTGGYTGTLVLARNGWKEVSADALRRKGWGYVVYGSGIGFHTEAFIGPGDRTGGHGDARVNFGSIYLFGTGTTTRCFIYEGS